MKRQKTKIKPKRDRLRILYDKAWTLMSLIVRKRDKGRCFTCDDQVWNMDLGEPDIRPMQAGHFKHGKLDFDFMNINCQCQRCNHYLSGNLGEYAIRLIKKYGIEKVEDLQRRALQEKGKPTEEEYEKLIVFLKDVLKQYGEY